MILLAISHATYLTRKALPDTSGAPNNTSAPTIEGSAAVGETLSADAGKWTPEPPQTRRIAGSVPKPSGRTGRQSWGAEADTYKLVDDDAGKRIRVVVTVETPQGRPSRPPRRPRSFNSGGMDGGNSRTTREFVGADDRGECGGGRDAQRGRGSGRGLKHGVSLGAFRSHRDALGANPGCRSRHLQARR